jgi:hypothetical protein
MVTHLSTGGMATSALAYFGRTEARRAIDTYLKYPETPIYPIRDSLGMVILSMLQQRTIDDPKLLQRLNDILIKESYSRHPLTRTMAAQRLSYFHNEKSYKRLKEMAATDPWSAPGPAGAGRVYGVRIIAQSALDGPIRQSQGK